METLNVLFVDDEPNLLAGLKRLCRAYKDEWTAHFCASGSEALALMAMQPMDVVVSDMRMPSMDGAELLSHVRDCYPGTIRVILSGYADTECVLRTVGPAHVYLAKPCSAHTISDAISRPLALRRVLRAQPLRDVVAGLTDLPTPPELFARLQAELRSPKTSATSVAAIISQDMAMTAELLKLTNSAYFSLGVKATSVSHAVRILGIEMIEVLILRIGIVRQLGHDERVCDLVRALNGYSLEIASLAERIALANGCDESTAKAAFCAGMLSFLGHLVFLDAYPDHYTDLLAHCHGGKSLSAAEEEAFGASHAHVGAYLLGLWGFTDLVVEAVAHSFVPSQCPVRSNDVLTAVHAARALGPPLPLLPGQPAFDMSYVCEARQDLRIVTWRELAQTIGENANA